MVSVYLLQHAQGHMCSMGLSQQVWGSRDGRWYGNRVNFGRARDVWSLLAPASTASEEILQFSPIPFSSFFFSGDSQNRFSIWFFFKGTLFKMYASV